MNRNRLLLYTCVASTLLAACGSDPVGTSRVALRAFVTSSQVEPSAIPIFCSLAALSANLTPIRHPTTKKESVFRPLVAQNGVDSIPISADDELTDLPDAYWESIRGELLFPNKQAVLTRNPMHTFDVSEFGSTEPHGEMVWTGINPNDAEKTSWLGYKCTSRTNFRIWSSYENDDQAFTGSVGGKDRTWLGGQEWQCNKLAHIYCFETFPN